MLSIFPHSTLYLQLCWDSAAYLGDAVNIAVEEWGVGGWSNSTMRNLQHQPWYMGNVLTQLNGAEQLFMTTF
jgi:hypothetical protein